MAVQQFFNEVWCMHFERGGLSDWNQLLYGAHSYRKLF